MKVPVNIRIVLEVEVDDAEEHQALLRRLLATTAPMKGEVDFDLSNMRDFVSAFEDVASTLRRARASAHQDGAGEGDADHDGD